MRRKSKVRRPKAALTEPLTLKLRSPTYQPKKAETEERRRIAATSYEVPRAILTPTKLLFGQSDQGQTPSARKQSPMQ